MKINVNCKLSRLIAYFWQKRIIRFLVIGGINTIFGYIVFATAIYLGLHYSMASLLSIILGILFNFKTSGKIVFKNSSNRLIFQFAFVYLIVYGVHVLSLSILNSFGINNYIGGAILVLPIALLTYILQSKIVFKYKKVYIHEDEQKLT